MRRNLHYPVKTGKFCISAFYVGMRLRHMPAFPQIVLIFPQITAE
jgi:hypothetical protein